MIEKKYRKWGSMRNAKLIKLQIEDDTLIFLEHRSFIGAKTQVGYGKAVDDLCRDFQGLLREYARLLHSHKQLLDKYSSVYALGSASPRPGEIAMTSEANSVQELCSPS